MPKFRLKPPPIERRKTWECPGCGETFVSNFDGEWVTFTRPGIVFARCGGIYETVEIGCPKCGGRIEFTKGELEEEL